MPVSQNSPAFRSVRVLGGHPSSVIASTLALLVLAQADPSAPEAFAGRALPARLRGLPVGLLIQHHPNPCLPERKGDGYVWRHDTTVQSLAGELRIVEYGAFLFTNGGWRLRVVLTPADFARQFRCPGARLRQGRVYADPDNARFGDKASAGDALWFFVAEDAKERRVKGTGLIETEGLP